MTLKYRFSLIILAIFLGGWIVAGVSIFTLERSNARKDSIHTAEILLSTAVAARNYTSDLVAPLLENQTSDEFIKERVPSYAAQQIFQRLDDQYKDYYYSETALNPTNPKDLAAGWQVDLIKYFIDHPDETQVVDTRVDRDQQTSLYVAVPIPVSSPKCLVCHSTPEAAPPSLIKTYGSSNGFGWELNQIIGTRVISVPTSIPDQRSNNAIISYLLLTASVFLIAYSAINIVVQHWITAPLDIFAKMLEEISTQQSVVDAQLPEGKFDSISRLNKAVSRLIISLDKSLLKGK